MESLLQAVSTAEPPSTPRTPFHPKYKTPARRKAPRRNSPASLPKAPPPGGHNKRHGAVAVARASRAPLVPRLLLLRAGGSQTSGTARVTPRYRCRWCASVRQRPSWQPRRICGDRAPDIKPRAEERAGALLRSSTLQLLAPHCPARRTLRTHAARAMALRQRPPPLRAGRSARACCRPPVASGKEPSGQEGRRAGWQDGMMRPRRPGERSVVWGQLTWGGGGEGGGMGAARVGGGGGPSATVHSIIHGDQSDSTIEEIDRSSAVRLFAW